MSMQKHVDFGRTFRGTATPSFTTTTTVWFLVGDDVGSTSSVDLDSADGGVGKPIM